MRITVVLSKFHENILEKQRKQFGITQTEVVKRALELLDREEKKTGGKNGKNNTK